MKSLIIASAAVAPLMAGAAFAGPYVNIESNSSFAGNDYTGSLLETHVGVEGSLGEDGTWYAQGGPAINFADGEDASTELSAKVGASVAVTENTSVYGEVSGITKEQIDLDAGLNMGVKAGVKFSF